MIRKIVGEQPFQVINDSFSVSKSKEKYYLAYSANGVNYTKYKTPVPAGEELLVTCHPGTVFYKLIGNKSEVEVNG